MSVEEVSPNVFVRTDLRGFFPLARGADEARFSKAFQDGIGRFYDILQAEAG